MRMLVGLGQFAAFLPAFALLYGCTTREEETVRLSAEPKKAGALEVRDLRDNPVPPPRFAASGDAAGLVQRSLEALNLTPQDRQNFAKVILASFGAQKRYGVGIKIKFDSFKVRNLFRVKAPRFVQLARFGFCGTTNKGNTIDISFQQSRDEQPWVIITGKKQPDGWFVDKLRMTDNPVHELVEEATGFDLTLPFISQEWRDGHTELTDVAGIINPWEKPDLVNGGVIIMEPHFQTWLIAPRIVTTTVPEIPDELDFLKTLESMYPSNVNGPLIQPPAFARIPQGFVRWTFRIRVAVGKGERDTTWQYLIFPTYEWVDRTEENISVYRFLMEDVYPDWVP